MFTFFKKIVVFVFIFSHFWPSLISFADEMTVETLAAQASSSEQNVPLSEGLGVQSETAEAQESDGQGEKMLKGNSTPVDSISEIETSSTEAVSAEDNTQSATPEGQSTEHPAPSTAPSSSGEDTLEGQGTEMTPWAQGDTPEEGKPQSETSQSETTNWADTEHLSLGQAQAFGLRADDTTLETLSGEEEVLEEQQDPEPIIGSSYKMLWEVGNPAYGDGGLTIDFTIWAGGPVTIHWGDGTQETLPTASDQIVSHTYTAPGSYTVQIAGDLKRFRTNANNNNARHAPKLHKVLDWGGIQWSQNNGMFRMAKNLTEVPVDAPNLSHDISTMFWWAEKFNQNINHWNTSHVTNMVHMFRNAKNFNQPLNNWDTSRVKYLSYTFGWAEKFNQDISNWNTEQVSTMEGVFNGAKAFNQPLTNWNTSKVTNMAGMFANATVFNQPLNHFDTSQVTNMRGMFNWATVFNQDISNWNTSNVTNMAEMFRKAINFDQYLWDRNVQQVIVMDGMFADVSYNQPLTNWQTDSLQSTASMFVRNMVFNQPLNHFNMSNVTSLNNMFYHAESFDQPVNSWNTKSVRDMRGVFFAARKFNQPLTNWNTSQVTNMASMFQSAERFNQSLESFDTSKVTDMNNMFHKAYVFNQPIGHFDTSKVVDMAGMLRGALVFNQPLTNWNTSHVTNMREMFWDAVQFNQPLAHFDTSKVTDMNRMFRGARAFNQEIGNWNTEQVTNMREMFYEALVFNKPIWGWNTSKVTKMDYMFYRAPAFDQSLENWDTREVTQMHRIFNGATAFNQPLTNWNTSKVTNMEFMFASASKFNQPLAHFDTSRVTTMQGMFQNATIFNQPLTNWNTSELINMEQMFFGARAFNQPLNHFTTSKVTNMQSAFVLAKHFDQDISNWDTSKVTNMNSLFGYSNFSQDISSWDISAVTSMENIFRTSKAYPAVNYDKVLTQRKQKLNPAVTTLGRVNACYRTAGVVRATFLPSGAPDDRGECPNWDQQGPVFSTGLVKSFDPDSGELYFAFTGATDNDEVSHYLLTLQQCDLSGLNCTTISQSTVGALLEEGDAQLTHQASVAVKRYIFTVVAVDRSNNQSQPLTAEQDVYTAQINFATDEGWSLIGSTNAVIFSGVKWSTVQLPSVQANQGYQFDRWDPELPSGETRIVSDATFTAKFIEVEDQRITINFTSDNVHGSISTVAPQKVLKTTTFGALNKPTITPNAGYVAHWNPNKPEDSADFTAINAAEITYTISFVEKAEDWITVKFASNNQNGIISTLAPQKVLKTTIFGALNKPTITPNAGYVAHWNPNKPEDSADFMAINDTEITYTISFVERADDWITVNFSSDNQNGTISTIAPQKVLKTTAFGTLNKPTITPNAGYVAHWSPNKPEDSADFTAINAAEITYTISFIVPPGPTIDYRISYFTGDATLPFLRHKGMVNVNELLIRYEDIPDHMPAGYVLDTTRSTTFPVHITMSEQEILVRYRPENSSPLPPSMSSSGGSGGGWVEQRKEPIQEPLHEAAPAEELITPVLTELESAYHWAYQHEITTLAPFEDARLDQAITRAELSKMLSVYAIKFAQKEPQFDKLGCKSYADLWGQSDSLQHYASLSCMLGIMGLLSDGYTPLDYFMPSRSVSRAELATTISRLLYGARYDNHSPDQWWADHLAKLHADKIMTVSEPELIEQRGYILLVLWRLAQMQGVNGTSW